MEGLTMLYKGSFVSIEDANKDSLLDYLRFTKLFLGKHVTAQDFLVRDNQSMQIVQIYTEKSDRTKIAYDLAASRMGAYVVDNTEPKFSGMLTGDDEFLQLIRNYISAGANGFIMRLNNRSLSMRQVADMLHDTSDVRLVSAGENHVRQPSQTLCDIFTVYVYPQSKELSVPLTYAMLGDLHSPTMQDFLHGISYFGATGVFCAGSGRFSKLMPATEEALRNAKIPCEYVDHPVDAVRVSDVVYLTQHNGTYKDTFFPSRREQENYTQEFGSRCISGVLPEHSIVMHPGPHGSELELFIDREDPRFVHQKMAEYGRYTKASILVSVFASHFLS